MKEEKNKEFYGNVQRVIFSPEIDTVYMREFTEGDSQAHELPITPTDFIYETPPQWHR